MFVLLASSDYDNSVASDDHATPTLDVPERVQYKLGVHIYTDASITKLLGI